MIVPEEGGTSYGWPHKSKINDSFKGHWVSLFKRKWQGMESILSRKVKQNKTKQKNPKQMFRCIDTAFKNNYMKSLAAILLFPIMKLPEIGPFFFHPGSEKSC